MNCFSTASYMAPQPCCSGRFSVNQAASPAQFASKCSFVGTPLLAQRGRNPSQARGNVLPVQMALSRAKKEETVEKLVAGLENSAVVFGMRFKFVSVKSLQEFRRSLPEKSKVVVAKNRLMSLASTKVEGWSEIEPACQGDNAWVFIHETEIPAAIKAFLAFEKKLVDAMSKEDKEAKRKPTDISGGVLDGKFLTYEEVKKLEKLPTKAQLMAQIACLIKQTPTNLAVAIKQIPTKVATATLALAEGDEAQKSLLVGAVFPKPEATPEAAAE